MSIFARIVSRESILRGWSADRKYRAVTEDGTAYFLRISPEQKYAQRRLQFDHMLRARELGVPVCEPVECGLCREGCYQLLGWVEGRDAEKALPQLAPREQYAYGITAGQMLRKLHTLPAPMKTEPWADQWNRKADKKLAAYERCSLKYEKGARIEALIRRDRHLVQDRPTVWHHGDYHCGNLMLDGAGRLWVIDFDREDVGDPWYEFNRLIWDVRAGEPYARGMLDGYFDGAVPEEFWKLLRLYQCGNMISSLPWAEDFGDAEVQTALDNAERILAWYDDLNSVVPNWYRSTKK